MIPDIEKVLAEYLRGRDEFTSRVVGKTPSSKSPGGVSLSWVRLTVLDAPQAEGSTADRLVPFYVQFDCYAGADKEGEQHGQPEASLIARTVRALLVEMPDHSHSEAVVTAARINGMTRVPDAGFEPARERIILTATVWAR